MKNLNFVLLFIFSFLTIHVFAQTTLPNPIEPGVEITDLVGWVDFVYMILVNIIGFIGHVIPGVSSIKEKTLRVVAIGSVLAVAFVALGWSNLSGLLLGFLAATQVYDLLLKPMFVKKTNSVSSSSVATE